MKELRNYTCSAKHANCQAVFAKNRHSRRNVAYVAVTTLFKAFSGGSRNWWKKGRHRGCGAPHRGSEAVPRAEVQGHVVGCLGALTPKNTLEASRKALWWCKRQVHRWQPTVNFCTIFVGYLQHVCANFLSVVSLIVPTHVSKIIDYFPLKEQQSNRRQTEHRNGKKKKGHK